MAFLCHFCGKEFNTKQSYARHWTSFHEMDESTIEKSGRISCGYCKKKFKLRENLRNHISRVHNLDTIFVKCELCEKEVAKASYKHHMMTEHSNAVSENDNKILNCPICNERCRSNLILKKHMKEEHNIAATRRSNTTKCPLCGFVTNVRNRNVIETHFVNIHNVSIETRSITFNTIGDFFFWKEEIEKETSSRFIKAKTASNVVLYKCHLSGKYSTNTKRRGSVLLHGFCPAYMRVKQGPEVSVTYQLTHVGHNSDLTQLTFVTEDQPVIETQLPNNIPLNDILENMKGTSIQTIQVIDQDDLNLKKSFDLSTIAVEHAFNLREDGENVLNITTEYVPEEIEQVDISEVKITPDNYEIIDANQNMGEKIFQFNTIEQSFNLSEEINLDIEQNCKTEIEIENDSKQIKSDISFSHAVESSDYNTEDLDETDEAIENLLLFKQKEVDFLDADSISEWVESLKRLNNTALIVYKPKGCTDYNFPDLKSEDFLLIFMTDAQKDILYRFTEDIVYIEDADCYSVKLYALLIPDETRDGFPIAFMLTNRGDEFDMKIFFENVREVAVITPKAFMSNSEELFYSAWNKVMEQDTLHIFSTQHVFKLWKMHINAKIKIKDKRNEVFKSLRKLLYELEETNFQNGLEEMLMKWKQDKDVFAFQEYFNQSFVKNEQCQKWAYCYRVKAGIDTNMSIDSYNKMLKYCNLYGDKTKPNQTLCEILNLLRVKLFELIIKVNKGKVAKKLQNLRLRHSNSYENDSEYVIQEEHKWQVLNYEGNELSEAYIIKKLKDCNKCLLRCYQCNTCFHEYVCSCEDRLVKNNMCSHIHLVARTQKLMENEDSDKKEDNEENSVLNDIGVEQIADVDLPFAVKKRQFIEEIRKNLEDSVETPEQLDFVKEQFTQVQKKLKPETKV